MSHFNAKLLRRIPYNFQGVMEYYPDVILFEFNQVQYTHVWNTLSSAQYLYTNGYEIRPTHWLMYAFQSFKGWLGFSNNCHPEKISYTLNKLAYYGYMQKFTQPDLLSETNGFISPKMSTLLINEHNDETTAKLQREVVTYYFNAEPYLDFDYAYQHLNSNHRFGDSWKRIHAWEQIPLLDPQDDSLIAETLDALDQNQALEVRFLGNTKYAKAAAQYYCDKAKNMVVPSLLKRLFWNDPRPKFFAKALVYDPEIAKQDAEHFILHHLQQKEYQQAFNLLSVLMANPQLVIKYLLEFPVTERNSLILKNSPIAAIMAGYHIEKKQYEIARQYYEHIEDLSPAAAFSLEIKNKNFIGAYAVFKNQADSSQFSSDERRDLAGLFAAAAETSYETAKSYKDTKNWKEAEHYYLQSLEQKKAAHHLDPSDESFEDVYIHKRLYATLLIHADLNLHQPEESNIASIHKAIVLLRECHSDNEEEQKYQKHALASGLMRQVDTLRENIAMTYANDSDVEKHKLKYQQELSAFIKILKEIIELLDGTKDKNLRLKLGKAHYLLADVQLFFNINAPDINLHYKKAMEAVPDNPFYVLRVSELFDEHREKHQEIGITHLKKMGYNVHDFMHWSDERWVKKDKIINDIKDIHQAPMR